MYIFSSLRLAAIGNSIYAHYGFFTAHALLHNSEKSLLLGGLRINYE